MSAAPERAPERDAALLALLPQVGRLGWTYAALRRGLRDSGADPADAESLFPGGTPDLLEAWIDLEDRQMAAAMAEHDTTGLRLPARVRLAIELRLAAARPHREAVRRAVTLLLLPRYAWLSARTLARTVDAIWHAAGDRSADTAWYTKRLILGTIYPATLLFWLRDPSADNSATLAFLDRRLAGHARFHRAQQKCSARLSRWLPGEAA